MGKAAEADGFDAISAAWDCLRNSCLCVTGATGLIGSHLVKHIVHLNEECNINCQLVLLVRNKTKALTLFGEKPYISLIDWDMSEKLPDLSTRIDYIVHAASPTSSQGFLASPVEVIDSICNSTKSILTFATDQHVAKTVVLSTMEVYGEVSHEITESEFGSLDPMVVRNCYPESKRLAENMVASYAHEYKTHACVLRLAQTFGAGVELNDSRVFAEFARCAITSNDIVLFSDGQKKNPYLSLDDAINAIAVTLVYGEDGQAYNVANRKTYCSIYEMAEMVLKNFGSPAAKVLFGSDKQRQESFRKSTNLSMNTSKIEALGWKPQQDLEDMYRTMIDSWVSK